MSICKYQKSPYVKNSKFHIDNFGRHCPKIVKSICNHRLLEKNDLPSTMPISSVLRKLLSNFVSSIQITSFGETFKAFSKHQFYSVKSLCLNNQLLDSIIKLELYFFLKYAKPCKSRFLFSLELVLFLLRSWLLGLEYYYCLHTQLPLSVTFQNFKIHYSYHHYRNLKNKFNISCKDDLTTILQMQSGPYLGQITSGKRVGAQNRKHPNWGMQKKFKTMK